MKMLLVQFKIMAMELAIPAVFMLPIIAAACRIFRLKRGAAVRYALFFLYLCGVYGITGMPNITYFRWEPNLYLIPILGVLDDGYNSVLNVLMFIPMGFFLPLLCRSFQDARKTMGFALAATLMIELSQLFTFRLTDVNDLLTNILGAYLGYLLASIIPEKCRAHVPAGWGCTIFTAAAALLVEFAICPYLQPILWDWLY